MAESSSVSVSIPPPQSTTSRTLPLVGQISNSPRKQEKPTIKLMVGTSIGHAANLLKPLPGVTVLAFQALSSSFSNRGACHDSNRILTAVLIGLCTLSCCFFAFSDSFIGKDGKVYYGIATLKGLYIFNKINNNYNDSDHEEEEEERVRDMGKYKICILDFIHAIFSSLVFLALALSDSNIVECFFARSGVDAHELVLNIPLGISFLSGIVFIVFPTSRKGIGCST
ncbi:protein DMP2-like [Telopea speciosissima]|uniref:protein DMP2-like n=1 Tax=Telopea speciosissima TaxID=54955 RepID=UPI001CC65678|nr:protein DMP2-like [Telopea speciosissima]